MEKLNVKKQTMIVADNANSSAWLGKQQQEVEQMRSLYGTAEQFLDLFKPELQLLVAREWQRAYRGTAPKLSVVTAGYGFGIAEVWTCIQLEDINCFAGVKEKLSIARQKDLSKLCIAEYGYLKVTELMLCFHRLKCGRYGRFYGSVDALFIASALLQFTKERHQELARISEEEAKQRKTEEVSPTAITYAEYLAAKQQKESNINQQPNSQSNQQL